jgi:hypothetical protein
MHCRTCCRTFEAATAEEALKQVAEHEAKADCSKPVYDGKGGRFVKWDSETAAWVPER